VHDVSAGRKGLDAAARDGGNGLRRHWIAAETLAVSLDIAPCDQAVFERA